MSLLTFCVVYLLGSIPFGYIITRAAGLGDVRKIGSGNIGATNVMRTGKRALGITTLLLDALKGFLAVKYAQFVHNSAAAELAGLVVVLGHIFPIWLRFKGGKGVATALGVIIALNPPLAIAAIVIWVGTFSFVHIASLASIFCLGYSPLVAYLLHDDMTALLCLGLALIVVYTHRTNIKRLIEGTEHKFRRSPA